MSLSMSELGIPFKSKDENGCIGRGRGAQTKESFPRAGMGVQQKSNGDLFTQIKKKWVPYYYTP